MPDVNSADLRIREAMAHGLGEAMRKACPIDATQSLPAEWLALLAQIEAATESR